MNIEIGSIKRFADFMGNLTDKDKVALISHTDLDGLASAKIANEVLQADLLLFLSYGDLNQKLIDKLKLEKITKVVLTDLLIENPEFILELEKNFHILVIDHHIAPKDYNSNKVVYIKCESGYCAGYLCYELFSKIKNLEYLDWLVACSCISDFCHIKPAEWLEKVFAKYQDKYELDNLQIKKSSKFYKLQDKISLALVYYREELKVVFKEIGKDFGDIGNLGKAAGEVENEILSSLKRFESEKEEFPDGYFWMFNPDFKITSLVSTALSVDKYPNKTLIIARQEKDTYVISARRQDKKVNMNDFVKSLLSNIPNSSGGGHIPAAGGSFPIEYLEEFKKRLGIKQ